jgi:hypothetical protein
MMDEVVLPQAEHGLEALKGGTEGAQVKGR